MNRLSSLWNLITGLESLATFDTKHLDATTENILAWKHYEAIRHFTHNEVGKV